MGFGSFFKKARKFALPAIGALLAPGVGAALGVGLTGATGAAIGSGAASLWDTKNPLAALGAGAGSYIGGNIASSLLGSSLGTVGSAIGAESTLPWNSIGSALASGIGPTAANSIISAPISGVLGSTYGSSIGEALGGAGNAKKSAPSLTPALPAFKPKQEAERDVPPSIAGMGQLTPQQRTSNIATQGVYGSGAGSDEQSYFLNQINRRLVDESGAVDQDTSELSPIELSYLQRLGIGGYGNTSNLLEAISKWRPA